MPTTNLNPNPVQTHSNSQPLTTIIYAVGLDIGSEQCSACVIRSDKSVVIKPFDFPNVQKGFLQLVSRLSELSCEPAQFLIGLEATGRYWENLYHFLAKLGYQLQLLHPAQTHEFSKQRRLRAKTDHLDSNTIARFLLSDEVRPAYVPNELITTYRELIRLQNNLTEEVTRYRNEIHAMLVVLFPEFTQVFSDPTRSTALALLKLYPGAQAIAAAGEEALCEFFQKVAPNRYGRKNAQHLYELATRSTSSGMAQTIRARGLVILCGQLEHTFASLNELESEIAKLVELDQPVKVLLSVPEFGSKVVTTIRAELGEVERFTNSDQVVAYVGLDLTVKQSGKWRGQTKLSKQGSGLLRRMLYMAALACVRMKSSAFKDYYLSLVGRGLKGRTALVAVMRKMIVIAFRLLKSGEIYDPGRVWAGAISKSSGRSDQNPQLVAIGA